MDTKKPFTTFAESLFAFHRTRMFRKEKDRFLSHCTAEFEKLGYENIAIKEAKNDLGMTSKNLMVGAPDAEVLITAHYDTPGRNGFLMFLNPLLGIFIGVHLSLLLVYAPIFAFQIFSPTFVESLLLNFVLLIINIACIFISIAIFASFFIKNPNNYNDNTSGVIGVYKLAELIADNPELKSRCAFVLFDHEELGLLGSRAFAKWRKKQHPDKFGGLVINLDCVGTGNILTVMTKAKHDSWHKIAEFMGNQGYDVKKIRGGLSATSDHAPFPNGISLLFQKRSLLGPLYIPRIHSRKDKICDLDKIEGLCSSVLKYLEQI
ncbi:MAG: M28 family metallopeptidase [Oscillospiraceae bacterium]|nr:M28 family metallopeptidase [Oscillospiraceae bacterium]